MSFLLIVHCLTSIPRLRQKVAIDERLKGTTERIAGVDRCVEAGLAKLDGTHEGNRACRSPVCKRKVGMLIALPDKRAQVTACKAVLGDDLRPDVSIIANISCEAG